MASPTALTASPCTCMSWRQFLSFHLMEQPPLTSHLSSAACSPVSLHRIEASEDLTLDYVWLKDLVWSFIQTSNTCSVSAVRLFYFLIIPVFSGAALSISFKKFSFAFTTWLTVGCKRPSFRHILAFDMPSSPRLNLL